MKKKKVSRRIWKKGLKGLEHMVQSVTLGQHLRSWAHVGLPCIAPQIECSVHSHRQGPLAQGKPGLERMGLVPGKACQEGWGLSQDFTSAR